MSDLSFFPGTRAEALALEYAKAKMTETTTPEDFCKTYIDAFHRILETFKADREARRK